MSLDEITYVRSLPSRFFIRSQDRRMPTARRNSSASAPAGDRGLFHPELVHSATRDTLIQILSASADTCFISANRTCELGMRQTTGRVYESFVYALEESSREVK